MTDATPIPARSPKPDPAPDRPSDPAPGVGDTSRRGAIPARVASRLVAELDAVVPRLGQRYREELEEYARAWSPEVERDVLATSRTLVDVALRAAIEGRDPETVDFERLSVAGRRRLEMGISLNAAMHAFRLAGREVWTLLTELVEPGEEQALAELGAIWITVVDQASSAFADGYLDASHERLRRQDARRQAIVDDLLDADDAAEAAAVASRHAISLAASYVPVLLVGADVLVTIDLAVQAVPPLSLAGRRGDAVLVLAGREPDADRLASRAGAELALVGDPAAPGRDLASVVAELEGLARVSSVAGRRGVARPRDLVLEGLLATATSSSTDVLATLVEDLDPDFRTTLAHYLRTGSVPEAARASHVHPNTAAYRLGRIAEQTGHDPRVPTSAALLVLALVARGDL